MCKTLHNGVIGLTLIVLFSYDDVLTEQKLSYEDVGFYDVNKLITRDVSYTYAKYGGYNWKNWLWQAINIEV